MSDIAIKAVGLRKVYVTGFLRKKFVGLSKLDVEVKRGETFGYIGPNGSGKTTTIKLLMGLNFPTAGHAEIFGHPIGSMAARAKVGYLPERPYFYDYLTALEFLHFYGQLLGMDKAARVKRIDELLPMVHMERARDIQLRKFSKGMLQRVGLAQALMGEPELVVLDEPSSGLDPMGRRLIRDVILELKRKGTTIMLSSHILADVEEVCDRVAIIAKGEIQQITKTSELVGHGLHGVEAAFENLSSELALGLGFGEPTAHAHGRVTFLVENHERVNALVRAALEAGGALIRVTPQRQSLESLFVDEMTAVDRKDREKPT
ncbi:MAG: ABC transporter ATP-binding protein [Proteobacteria bacterium]|nr:ABC transporter ATP-binding protein [Pseudomonadota bacterium]